jgi:hypothetical protein
MIGTRESYRAWIASLAVGLGVLLLLTAFLLFGYRLDTFTGFTFFFAYSQYVIAETYSPEVTQIGNLIWCLSAYAAFTVVVGFSSSISQFGRTHPWRFALRSWIAFEVLLGALAFLLLATGRINIE